MEVNKTVSDYMDKIGIKYVKNANDFIAGLAIRTDKDYAKTVAEELNSRAQGGGSGAGFYIMKNKHSLKGSLFISSAFDGGVFRHIGNLITDNEEYFNGSILDIGCDCGMVSCFIAKTYPNSKITAIDKNELAVERGKELAKKLGLDNIEFKTADILEGGIDGTFDTVTSFRTLLDVTEKSAKGLPFFGEREERENLYKNAFADYATAISRLVKDNGKIISVERYTADYGLLGWLNALNDTGITFNDKSCRMSANDISGVKSYSVTFGIKNESEMNGTDIFNNVMMRDFKSGTGCSGELAEFSYYNDIKEKLKSVVVYKDEKPVHEYQVAISNYKDKIMVYEASGNNKTLKYNNPKRCEIILKTIDENLSEIDGEKYKIVIK